MYEGPVVLGLAGTHAGVECRLRTGGEPRQSGGGRDRGLERPAVRALDALASSSVTRVCAPPAARLIQALATRPVSRAVLRCEGHRKHTLYNIV